MVEMDVDDSGKSGIMRGNDEHAKWKWLPWIIKQQLH